MRTPPKRQGFTLIELTVVLGIVTLLLTMAVGAHYAWKRYSALDAAEVRAVAMLSHARQAAIASGRPTLFAFGNGDIPYAEEGMRTMLDLSVGLTNLVSGWCCIVSLPNVLDESEALDALASEDLDPCPIVGDVATFSMPIVWGDTVKFDSTKWENCPAKGVLFLPDGSVSEEPVGREGAGATNHVFVLWGSVEENLKNRKTAQSRVLEVLPQSGGARALSREERRVLYGE